MCICGCVVFIKVHAPTLRLSRMWCSIIIIHIMRQKVTFTPSFIFNHRVFDIIITGSQLNMLGPKRGTRGVVNTLYSLSSVFIIKYQMQDACTLGFSYLHGWNHSDKINSYHGQLLAYTVKQIHILSPNFPFSLNIAWTMFSLINVTWS